MSVQKMNKFLTKSLHIRGDLSAKPIIISDSKGRYIQRHSDMLTQFGYSVDVIHRGGARFAEFFPWLQKNLHKNVNRYNHIVLYIWLGTCDLTMRKGKYIALRHQTEYEAVRYLQYQIDRYRRLVSNFPSVRLVFLEIPPYSIHSWNLVKGHTNPEKFHLCDKSLYNRICMVNDYIRAVNGNVATPKFMLDVERSHKKHNKKRRYAINYSLFIDGIHPSYILSRCWMKRIIIHILYDCQ